MSSNRVIKVNKGSFKLVKNVQRFPILYDNKFGPTERGKRIFQVSEAWSKVSMSVGLTKDECRKKWFMIRGYYASCLKSGRTYNLARSLAFLKRFMNPKTRKKSDLNNVGSRKKLKIEREMEINLQKCVVMFDAMTPKMKAEVKMRIGVVKDDVTNNKEKNARKKSRYRSLPKWTTTQKRIFIHTVQEFPVVYDNSGTVEEENDAWEEIAQMNRTTPTICRRKWRWFRVTFSRALGSGNDSYLFFNDLKFLKKYVVPVRQKLFIYSSDDSDDNSSYHAES